MYGPAVCRPASLVDDPTGERSGAITINTKKRKLYLSLGNGQAIEYCIDVGREGFAWKGVAQIGVTARFVQNCTLSRLG
jgi:lipoprotein-anchoring transpeptidase ErfK/SrfK